MNNVAEYLGKKGEKLTTKVLTPLANKYHPEVDIRDKLQDEEASYYQSLIGILRWIVELGRADMCVEVSMMSSHLALPRKGHMEQVLRMFAYLKGHTNSEIVFDPSEVEFDRAGFPIQDWIYSIYTTDDCELKEELPPNMPKPRSNGMIMMVYVDSDHAGDKVIRRSRTGFVIFLNTEPIYWISKKQTSCETSSFGSEFCAMKQAKEYVRELHYKR